VSKGKYTHIYSENAAERAACGAPLIVHGDFLVSTSNVSVTPTCPRLRVLKVFSRLCKIKNGSLTKKGEKVI